MGLLTFSDRKQRAALEALLDSYEVVAERQNTVNLAAPDVDNYFDGNQGTMVNTPIATLGNGFVPIDFDPAKYAVPGRTLVCRLTVRIPGCNGGGLFGGADLTVKLKALTADVEDGSYLPGAQVGESVTLAGVVGASAESDDFDLPAGMYAFAVAGEAADQNLDCQVALEVRRV